MNLKEVKMLFDVFVEDEKLYQKLYVILFMLNSLFLRFWNFWSVLLLLLKRSF